jgi:hypothetical protein
MPRSDAERMRRPRPLLQHEDGHGDLVLAEGIRAAVAQAVDAGRHDRVHGRCEGQLVDDDAGELVPHHVDPLPEDAVASSTAPGVLRKVSSTTAFGASPWMSRG